MAMMDAGVPLKAPVAGIAMGLVKKGEHYYDFIRYSRDGRSSWRYGL